MSSSLTVQMERIVTFTSPGRRAAQEDCVVADLAKRLAVVADGFGGAHSGVAAANLACASVKNFLFREAGDLEATLPFMLRPYFSLAGNVLFNALIHANREVRKLNQGKAGNESGGASLIAGFLDGDLLALGSVGACEAWIFRAGESARLVQPRTDAWLSDPLHGTRAFEGAEAVPLRAIGMAEDLEPELVEIRVKPGDWILLSTDGMTPAARDLIAAQHRLDASGEAAEQALQAWKTIDLVDNAAAALLVAR